MSPRGFVASEALSTAFSPFTPMAPPAAVLMVSQPAPTGSHLTVGIIGAEAAGAAAAPTDAGPWLGVVGPGKACGPEDRAVAFGPAVVPPAVEVVMNGPLSSEQPLAQPVAAEPTNVGESGT